MVKEQISARIDDPNVSVSDLARRTLAELEKYKAEDWAELLIRPCEELIEKDEWANSFRQLVHDSGQSVEQFQNLFALLRPDQGALTACYVDLGNITLIMQRREQLRPYLEDPAAVGAESRGLKKEALERQKLQADQAIKAAEAQKRELDRQLKSV